MGCASMRVLAVCPDRSQRRYIHPPREMQPLARGIQFRSLLWALSLGHVLHHQKVNPMKKKPTNQNTIGKRFTDEEYERLFLLAIPDNKTGATEEQIQGFIHTCEKLMIGAQLVAEILAGKTKVSGYLGNDPTFIPA